MALLPGVETMTKQIKEMQRKINRLESQIESHLDMIRSLEAESVRKTSIEGLEDRLTDAFGTIADHLGVAHWTIFTRRSRY